MTSLLIASFWPSYPLYVLAGNSITVACANLGCRSALITCLALNGTSAPSHRVHPSRCFHIQGVSFSLLDMSSQSVDRSWCGERCLTSQSIRRWCATVARLRHENNGGFHALQGEDGWLQGPAQTMCIAMLSHYTRD
ncbi:hypothetical protein V8E55_008369 [Tylopilus felleus]